MPEPGDVIITKVKFTDSDDSKIRPAWILFEELGNVVIDGITTNTKMSGANTFKSERLPKLA